MAAEKLPYLGFEDHNPELYTVVFPSTPHQVRMMLPPPSWPSIFRVLLEVSML